ncbi:MAG: hypothetical protein ACREVT_12835 [Burkholderiales bacterium]
MANQCPSGNTEFLGICRPPDLQAKIRGTPQSCGVGNPCDPGSGAKYQEEAVLRTPTLSLVLGYTSFPIAWAPPNAYPFGNNWAFNFGMSVFLTYADKAGVLRPDGKFLQFLPPTSGTVYISEPDVADMLEKLLDGASNHIGWKLTTAGGDTVETYDAQGKLVSIAERNGQTRVLTYSTVSTPASIAHKPGLLIAVTGHFGHQLNFTYDKESRVTQVTDPAGELYKFYYDESTAVVVGTSATARNLTSIEFPDQRKRLYHYNEQQYTAGANRPNALTGITDENASRFSTYQYGAALRATSTEHAGGVNRYSFVYNTDGTRIVTDPLNTSRTYTFQTLYNVVKPIGISGSACPSCGPAAQTYDGNGFVASRTDWNGNLTTYLRQDSNGRLDLETSRTEGYGSPQARTITTTWDPTFRLPALITEPGRTTSFSYDTSGNLLTRTVTDTALARSRIWSYTYNAIGQVLTIDGPRTDVSDITTYVYENTSGNLLTVTNPAGHVTQITGYDANGRPLTIVDPNGLTTTLTYFPRGWLSTRTVGSELTTYEYDGVGQLNKVTLPDASFLAYTFDAAHRLTEIADNLGNKIVYTLDAMGNRTREDVRDPGGSLAQTRTRVYDGLNRLLQDIGGTNPATQITQYGYDNQGNLTTITDPLNHVTTHAYDARNRLKQVTDPALGLTQYAYNALDQLVSVTDPRNNATTYAVDALDNLNSQTSPDFGATANSFDDAGNVLTSRDAKNQTTTYQYDALNRVTQITHHDGSHVQYGYDAGANGKGRLTSITETDSGGALQTQVLYAYDLHARLSTETRTIGAATFVTQYGYDSAGRLGTLTYPSGRQVAYSFDAAGRIGLITTTPAGGATQSVVSGVAYHPFGGAKSFAFGNGQSYARGIDLDGRIAAYTLGNASYAVGFDAASRIGSIANSGVPADARSFGYDLLDRLTSTLTPSTGFGFAYDANGNRTSKTVGAVTRTYAYPASNNRLASITGGGTQNFVHDPNGAITSDAVNAFTFDARGRLIQAATALGTVSYGLNALGQRYAKTVQGVTTLFHYDSRGRLIAETGPAGNTLAEYLYLGDMAVAIWR